MTVWKFPLSVADDQPVSMPRGAQILSVQMQGAQLCMWALVDPEAPKEVRRFRIVGTGHQFDEAPAHVHRGTFQMHGGALVFHVFERVAP